MEPRTRRADARGIGRSVRTSTDAVRPLVVAFIVAISITALLQHWHGLSGFDLDQYWRAAMRLREGEPLYMAGPNDRVSHYRYTPWFAYMWIPLTYLDREIVSIAWMAILVIASLAVVADLGRRGLAGIAAAAFFGIQLLWWVRGGNVQPLMVAALYFGFHSRAGPAFVAIAASLKVAPVLFLLVYVSRRQWRRAALGGILTIALGSLLIVHDLSGFGSGIDDARTNMSLFVASQAAWIVLAAGSAAVALALAIRGHPRTALAAGIGALAALPRLFMGDLTLLLASIGASSEPRGRATQETRGYCARGQRSSRTCTSSR